MHPWNLPLYFNCLEYRNNTRCLHWHHERYGENFVDMVIWIFLAKGHISVNHPAAVYCPLELIAVQFFVEESLSLFLFCSVSISCWPNNRLVFIYLFLQLLSFKGSLFFVSISSRRLFFVAMLWSLFFVSFLKWQLSLLEQTHPSFTCNWNACSVVIWCCTCANFCSFYSPNHGFFILQDFWSRQFW